MCDVYIIYQISLNFVSLTSKQHNNNPKDQFIKCLSGFLKVFDQVFIPQDMGSNITL